LKGTGFTGCGKTPQGHQIRQLCNKGTALAGPKSSKINVGLQPLLISPDHKRLFPQPLQAVLEINKNRAGFTP
jgi:hypothetical protein